MRESFPKLRTRLEPDFPLAKVRERLKCRIWSSSSAITRFLSLTREAAALHHLFVKEPR